MKHRIGVLAAAAWVAGSLASLSTADTPAAPTPVVAPAAANAAPRISQADLLARLDKKDPNVVVLDVRTAAEYAAGHVPGARNVSHDELANRLGELDALRDKDVVLYCRSGRRTALAEDVLRKAGFTKLLHLDGDYLAWQAENRPVEKSDAK
ncbi:MAG TPA: rhodanese-like domain-containing protein [Burkholderiaceae bacterium]|nr:rhodanese-like domain-containing protein [Burkholderiaceae bacterium]